MKLGRNRPIARGPRLHLRNYLLRSLPFPPANCDYLTKASNAIKQVYENDNLGDCVIAWIGHATGIFTGNSSDPVLFSDQQILALYGAIGGYVPGQPDTDQGCDEQTALAYWQQNGAIPGETNQHKIQSWLAVDGTNPVECRTAIWLFENLMFGVELPDAWVNPMPSRDDFTWDVAGEPDQANGHCFGAGGYLPGKLHIATWGMTGWITDRAVAAYATTIGQGELYTVLSSDSIVRATQKAPNGFDWTQLLADLQAIGHM